MSTTHSTSETGHAQNLASLRTLNSRVHALQPTYNPANTDLSADQIRTAFMASAAAQQALIDTEKPLIKAIADRKDAFEGHQAFATRILAALAATKDVQASVLTNAKGYNRKIQGAKLSSKNSAPAASPCEATTLDGVSTSQQSYIFLVQHFSNLLALLAQVPNYAPNEAPLQISAIEDYVAGLDKQNGLVADATIPYDAAKTTRNTLFYHPATGFIQLSKLVKAYVKSTFGATSDEYRQ